MSSLKQIFTVSSIAVIALLLSIGCEKQEIRPAKQQPSTMSETTTHAPQPITMDVNRHIHIDNIHATLPESWSLVPPTSQMRRAQFALKGTGSFEDGELAVFYLGPQAGGLEANLTRWYNQFSQPNGNPTEDVVKRENFEVNGMKMIMVSFTGTMKTSTMPGVPDQGEKANWMNLSAIVETPGGPWFFKSTGPAETLSNHVSAMKEFLNSVSINPH